MTLWLPAPVSIPQTPVVGPALSPHLAGTSTSLYPQWSLKSTPHSIHEPQGQVGGSLQLPLLPSWVLGARSLPPISAPSTSQVYIPTFPTYGWPSQLGLAWATHEPHCQGEPVPGWVRGCVVGVSGPQARRRRPTPTAYPSSLRQVQGAQSQFLPK